MIKKSTANFFDKRDAFLFYLNRVPYLDINKESKMLYASIGPQILPIARTTSSLIIKVRRVYLLLIRMNK